MRKLVLIIMLLFVLVGCQSVQASDDRDKIIQDHEQMIEDLIERIGELEQEVGNLKEDIRNGLYE